MGDLPTCERVELVQGPPPGEVSDRDEVLGRARDVDEQHCGQEAFRSVPPVDGSNRHRPAGEQDRQSGPLLARPQDGALGPYVVHDGPLVDHRDA